MPELIFWLIVIYILFKAVKIFLRYFISEVNGKGQTTNKTKTASKYKDAEEVDFIEIKNDKKTEKEQS